ncbi:MAG: FkbM family methyltransferase [Pseudomonadota bacterium]
MRQTLDFIRHHPLSGQRWLGAYARFFGWQARSRIWRVKHRIDWIEGSVLLVSKGMTGATGNIYCGLHEFADMEFLLHFLRPDDLFLDIGANVGSYTVLASKVVGARTIAFEPDPGTAAHLADNIDANAIAQAVTVHQVALGPTDGTVAFTVGLDTTNRVATPGQSNTRTVPVRRLDGIDGADQAVFAKIDVEGFEREVFRGADGILAAPNLMALATELDDPEIEQVLTGYGFQKFAYDPCARQLRTTPIPGLRQSNAIYARNVDAVAARLASSPKRSWRGLTI